jgi:hypothetical protein
MFYCDRSLVTSPYSYGLVLTEKDYLAEVKKLKIPQSDIGNWLGDGAKATAHIFNIGGKGVCIVALDDDKRIDATSKVCTLVHEAVHIWQYICKYIGEDNPSEEFEAYSIQEITHQLLLCYEKTKRKKKKKRD